MSLTEVVVRSATVDTLTENETWQAILGRWPTLSETEKWSSFLNYTMSFHYRYTLNYPSVTTTRYHIVPDDNRETCDAAVVRTLSLLRTQYIPQYNEQLEDDYDEEYESDAGSNNGDVWRDMVRSVQPAARDNYVHFAESLPFCVPLDLGSYRSYPFDNNAVLKWYCPCNRHRFAKFRTMFRISHSLDWECRDEGFNSLNGLLNHLTSKISPRVYFNESKLLHMIVNCYVREKHNAW
jgi:hypothetical protein